MDIFLNILLLIAGFVLLTKGADFFVDGSSGIATKLKIPQIIIGLTIVAMGTSAPEAAVSISAAVGGNADITVGNIVGSNILNVLIILGLSSAITRLAVQKDTIYVDMPVVIGATVLLIVLGLDGTIGLWDGIAFLVIFIAYMAYLFVVARKNINNREQQVSLANGAVATPMPELQGDTAQTVSADSAQPDAVQTNDISSAQSADTTDLSPTAGATNSDGAEQSAACEESGKAEGNEKSKEKPLWLALILTALGLAMIIFGSQFAVDSATFLAEKMGVSERFISLTVVALGTSLPELFTSVIAAIKKNADIAIGNIVGSNLFNILFITGLTAVITPVPFAQKFLIDSAVALGALLILWVPCLIRKSIGRITGITMLVCYCGYFVYLVLA